MRCVNATRRSPITNGASKLFVLLINYKFNQTDEWCVKMCHHRWYRLSSRFILYGSCPIKISRKPTWRRLRHDCSVRYISIVSVVEPTRHLTTKLNKQFERKKISVTIVYHIEASNLLVLVCYGKSALVNKNQDLTNSNKTSNCCIVRQCDTTCGPSERAAGGGEKGMGGAKRTPPMFITSRTNVLAPHRTLRWNRKQSSLPTRIHFSAPFPEKKKILVPCTKQSRWCGEAYRSDVWKWNHRSNKDGEWEREREREGEGGGAIDCLCLSPIRNLIDINSTDD